MNRCRRDDSPLSTRVQPHTARHTEATSIDRRRVQLHVLRAHQQAARGGRLERTRAPVDTLELGEVGLKLSIDQINVIPS